MKNQQILDVEPKIREQYIADQLEILEEDGLYLVYASLEILEHLEAIEALPRLKKMQSTILQEKSVSPIGAVLLVITTIIIKLKQEKQ